MHNHKIQGPSIGNGISNPGDHLRKTMVMIEEECGMRFKVYKVLGEGTYGVVYQALDFTTNKVSIIIILILNKQLYFLDCCFEAR
jgi:serine/threonine protein kinase